MVTMNDVAKRAGVSVATVSNVINNTRPVSPKTKYAVQQAIEDLNYVPNLAAKNLKTGIYKQIGVISEDLTSFNSAKIIDGICNYCDEHGYVVNLYNLRTQSTKGFDMDILTNILSLLRSSHIQGIIYVGAEKKDVSFLELYFHVPVVFAYCSVSENSHTIDYDDKQAAALAAEYLVEQGHSQIGILSGFPDQYFVQDRFNGFFKALDASQIPRPTADSIVNGGWSFVGGRAGMHQLLALPSPPTAVFAMNDLMASGAIAALQEKGLSVPEDISLLGFDDRSIAEYVLPALSTIHIPLFEIGTLATKTLLSTIEGNNDKIVRHYLPCTLIKRNSVKPL